MEVATDGGADATLEPAPGIAVDVSGLSIDASLEPSPSAAAAPRYGGADTPRTTSLLESKGFFRNLPLPRHAAADDSPRAESDCNDAASEISMCAESDGALTPRVVPPIPPASPTLVADVDSPPSAASPPCGGADTPRTTSLLESKGFFRNIPKPPGAADGGRAARRAENRAFSLSIDAGLESPPSAATTPRAAADTPRTTNLLERKGFFRNIPKPAVVVDGARAAKRPDTEDLSYLPARNSTPTLSAPPRRAAKKAE